MKVTWEGHCEEVEYVPQQLGLTTREALTALRTQLAQALSVFRRRREAQETWQAIWRQSFLHHNVHWSSLHWPGALLTLLSALALLGCHAIRAENSDGTALAGSVALLLLLALSLAALAWQQHLRREEMPNRVKALIQEIHEVLNQPQMSWMESYVSLFSPCSDAVSLQWTYRDGRLVNLPVSLLVEGDIIALRPGTAAPTALRGIQEEEHVVLSRGDVFSHLSSPPSPLDSDRPRPHSLLHPQLFRVTKTPAIETVQQCLELGQWRPVTVLDNERFTAQRLLERGLTPLLLVRATAQPDSYYSPCPAHHSYSFTRVLLLMVNLARYFLGAHSVGPWPVPLLQLPVNGVLPLLPLAFPLLWQQACVHGEVQVLSHLGAPVQGWREKCRRIWRHCVGLLCGKALALSYTTSLLHSLGSVTVLCCVDKQGILSWPTPSPEKILFFSRPSGLGGDSKRSTRDPEETTPLPDSGPPGRSVLEVLSLSSDRQTDAWVQFDDSRWQRHTSSLRPLGLGALLALCNPQAAARVWCLADHLTHASLLRGRPRCQPVCPPWGLCELSRILGFRPSAQEPFQQQMSLATYTLPSVPCAQNNSPWQPQPMAMKSLPLSHIISLVVHNSNSGDAQLFSYGSADTILATCVEFWDGSDLHPLTDADRKKVLDFYLRSCMAGHCLALSFKPLLQTLDLQMDDQCVEMPHGLSPPTGGESEGSPPDREEPLPTLQQQIFLGLVSSQYQARPDVVRLIAGLDSTCIRFVYFSLEEEVKSKLFAEKMGLETGWNCHISLQSDCFPLDPESLKEAEELGDKREGGELLEIPEASLLGQDGMRGEKTIFSTLDSEGGCLLEDLNRAKLPKGIENVRPHLENIDNVPLLVPLFTDCTAQTMCEMVQVMQEYGEVVCCLGSSQNINNNTVFLQSDISIALEPLFPSSSWTNPNKSTPQLYTTPPLPGSSPLSPTQLSSAICGLPCTIHLGSQENTTIIRLIKQFLACLCQLPPPLGTGDVLCLSCVHFPLLSLSLLGKPVDSGVMKVPTGKNLRFLPKKTQQLFVVYFLVKFGLTVCTYLACFGLMLHEFCLKIHQESEALCHLTVLLAGSSVNSTGPDWFGEHADGLALAQKTIAFFILLNAMCTSVSHVHRSNPLWRQSPHSNQLWLTLQVSITTAACLLWADPSPQLTFDITDIPAATWLLGSLWLLPLMCINEWIKLHEIRTRERYHKRRKLQFDTKLGMNSPF
ncbi:transmembrane protein 94-like [Amia ocellicauda]|uniref:transmembrane protein 94-like n=1 Tax=Amia ocellicauda TaxID=2972642 RepID=UPI003463B8B5